MYGLWHNDKIFDKVVIFSHEDAEVEQEEQEEGNFCCQ